MDGYACIAPAVEWSIENLEQVIYAGKWVFLTSFPVVRSLRVWCAVVCVLVLSVSSELWVLINNILWKKIKEWYRCEDMYRCSWRDIATRERSRLTSFDYNSGCGIPLRWATGDLASFQSTYRLRRDYVCYFYHTLFEMVQPTDVEKLKFWLTNAVFRLIFSVGSFDFLELTLNTESTFQAQAVK